MSYILVHISDKGLWSQNIWYTITKGFKEMIYDQRGPIALKNEFVENNKTVSAAIKLDI